MDNVEIIYSFNRVSMINRLTLPTLLLAILIGLAISPANVGAQTTGGSTSEPAKTGISIPNPLGNCNDASCVISRIIRAILGVVAVVATFMFIWGGVLMLTSGGNERQVRQAKDTLTWAAIGIIIIIVSWSIIRFVLETFLRAS